uniref:Uncharacterized protein n=1 Tax=uncultured Chloroflexi bacterium HF0200_09I09 TaxID=710736 RepID=E0XU91_9CHLR|nr:hypothetical protein [uncultured Chloroflexi bacterium HF0200_09I09]
MVCLLSFISSVAMHSCRLKVEVSVGLWRHLVVFGALVVNLWIGGDLVEVVAGPYVRGAFELLLIFGYLWLVVGLGGLLWGRTDEQS